MPFRIVLHGRLTLSPKCQEWAGHCWPALVCRYVYFYILLIGYCPSKMSVSVKPSFFLLQTNFFCVLASKSSSYYVCLFAEYKVCKVVELQEPKTDIRIKCQFFFIFIFNGALFFLLKKFGVGS